MKKCDSTCEGSHACGDVVEEGAGAPKKFPCADCTFCQWCSDDRCRLCRCTGKRGRKLSIAEQIALYESVNGRG